jgi:uncharacterized phage protein (TIGR02218 family)
VKTISAALKAHMALGTTTLAHLVKLTRKDGTVLAVTLDHDQPITFESVTYEPAFGMSPSTIETSAALNVDNLDAKGALLALGVDEAGIVAGLWDLCDVRVLRVNWADLTMGAEKLKRGNFGELSLGRNTFSNEIRGITQRLQSTIGDLVSPSCKADLFDARCGVAATEGVWKFSSVAVSTIVSAQRQFTASALTQTAGFFDAGKVTWTSGANAGLSKEIKGHTSGGAIELQEPMPYAIVAGDQATFFAGCLKRGAEDCSTKFSNIVRFRGFKDLPGQDQMFKGKS